MSVRQLPFTEKGQRRYFDESTPGFGVTVGTRTKTFIVICGPKRQLTTIGRYPDVSLQDARREAKRLLATFTTEDRTTKLRQAVDDFLEDCEKRLRPNSVKAYRLALRDAPDILLKDASKRLIPTTSPHDVKAYKALFNWCQREELTDRNPFQHVSVSFTSRSRVLTDDEIRAVWQYDYPPFSYLIKLCLLTGQRRNEVAQFNEAWVRGDTITIPASVAKNNHEHTLPFNLLTAQYLNRYLGQSFNGWSKGKARLDKHVPLPHWTIHDLRRTFSTTHARLGTPLHVTERLLNHVSGTVSGVAATYNRYSYMKEMREASLHYETFIANLVGAKA